MRLIILSPRPGSGGGEQDLVDDVDGGVGCLDVAADDLGLADHDVLPGAGDSDHRPREGLVVTGVPEGVRIITAGQDLVQNGEKVDVVAEVGQ